MANVVTIREAVRRSKEDGLPVSEYTLRQWIKMGEIPHRIAGRRKILIFYPNLVQYLKCNNVPEIPATGIDGSIGRW